MIVNAFEFADYNIFKNVNQIIIWNAMWCLHIFRRTFINVTLHYEHFFFVKTLSAAVGLNCHVVSKLVIFQ